MDRRQMVPDCLTGAIMAAEGIEGAATVLNGPTGCKFLHSTMSETQFHRDSTLDPLAYASEFYFGQPRVPCTYLDDHDYIYGSGEKLSEAIPRVIATGPELVSVINSPGASLIGDDLSSIVQGEGVPMVTMETTGFSGSMAEAFQRAVLGVMEAVPPRRLPRSRGRVNLVGISIWHSHWRGSVEEIRRMLGMCGIEVNAVIGAGWSVGDVRNSASVECNLVLHEEFADLLIERYRGRHGIPAYRPPCGAPVGLPALEEWLEGACLLLGADPSPAMEEIDSMRRTAHREISRLSSMTGLPRGATFAIHAEGSLLLPLTRFLHGHLGMVPVALDPYPFSGGCTARLEAYLEGHGLAEVLGRGLTDVGADVALADGNTLAMMEATGMMGEGIEIHLPSARLITLTERPLLGTRGTTRLLEEVLNALAYI